MNKTVSCLSYFDNTIYLRWRGRVGNYLFSSAAIAQRSIDARARQTPIAVGLMFATWRS
jgi:hypothetical protein